MPVKRITRRRRRQKNPSQKQRGGSLPWAVIQHDDRKLSDIDKGLMNRNKHYCQKWGHEYLYTIDGHEDMPPYWRKVFLVKDALATDKYKGVLWLDTDAAIHGMDTDLNSLVEEDKHFYKSPDITPTNKVFCAGVWFVMNTAIGKEIMAKWAEQYDRKAWTNNGKWATSGTWAGTNYEQGSFIEKVVPQYSANMKDYPETFLQALYPVNNPFILHFYFTRDKRQEYLDANKLPMIFSGGRRSRKQRAGTVPPVVFKFDAAGGFGSTVNVLLTAYNYAKEKGAKFYLNNADWHGSLTRWPTIFKSLEYYDPAKHGVAGELLGYPTFTGMKPYPLKQYGEAIKEIFIFQDHIVKGADDFIKTMGGPYTSIYVRRGDKVHGCAHAQREMELIPMSNLLDALHIKDDGIRLFVMSDDYAVVEETKAHLPNSQIFTLTPPENKGISQDQIFSMSPEEKLNHVNELFTSMLIFWKAEKGLADNRSNMGRLLKMGSIDKVQLYPGSPHLDTLTIDTPVNPSWRELGQMG